MSYSDTVEKIHKLLDSIDERSSLFKVDVEVFKKSWGNLQEEIEAKWKTLDTDVYKFEYNSAQNAVNVYINGGDILHSIYGLNSSMWGDMVLRGKYPSFKQSVVNRMLGAMYHSDPPKDLRAFKDKIIGSAKIVESRITQSFYNDLYNIHMSIEDGYKEIEQEWNKLETVELKDLIDRLNSLIEQAANEWVKQGGIAAGVEVYNYSNRETRQCSDFSCTVHHLSPEGVYNRFGYFIPYEDIALIPTWLRNERQVGTRVKEVLHPLEALSKYHSDTSH